jgi:hypothetical protein
MEVQTFLTGVEKQGPEAKVGAVTGKRLDSIFPNNDEIQETFGKIDSEIEASSTSDNLLIGDEQQDIRGDNRS